MEYKEKINELTIAKVTAEVEKLVAEGENYRKRNKWFEPSMILAIFIAGVAFAKLFVK